MFKNIITCEDCYYWDKQKDSMQGRCALLRIYPTGKWYCADGVTKKRRFRAMTLNEICKMQTDCDKCPLYSRPTCDHRDTNPVKLPNGKYLLMEVKGNE